MDDNKKKYKIHDFIVELILIVIGVYLIGLGTNIFLLPHKLTTGGASGIATIFYYLYNIPLGITILIINIPLFLISLFKIGFKFSLKTIFATILLSVFLDVFKYESIIQNNPIDMFTSSIFGGLIVGIGLSLVMKTGASTGGSDLLAQIIYQLTSIQSLSQVLLVIEVIIISAIMIVFKNINTGLYSIIAMFISTKMIDVIFEGIYYTKVATIITRKPDGIVKDILECLGRGATLVDSRGAHSNEKNTTITCIITRPQISKLKQIIKNNDKEAIIYISTTNEVLGRGFKVLS